MRPEFDSEIDSVLRGHARRGGASSAAWGGLRTSLSNEAPSGSHLDADEIAAFGEGALPAAARARYAAHLADCDDCRRSVTQVALAAGVPDRTEERVAVAAAAAAATRSPSWRERLAAVFAPGAWRYAMPVVALLAVSAVVLVVTRRLPREDAMMTAENRGAATRQVTAPAAPESHHADAIQQQPSAQPEAQTGSTAPAGVASGTIEERAAVGEGELAKLRPKGVDGVGQTAADSSAVPAEAQPEVARPAETLPAPPPSQSYAELAAATPSPLPPPAAAPRPMVLRDALPQPTPAPATENVAVAKKEGVREDSLQVAPRDEAPATKRHGPQRGGNTAGLAAAEASKDNRAARRTRGPQNNAQNNAAGLSRNEAGGAKAEREEDREQQAETRSVGGRRFRREGGVWIDTAYKPSQATVVVRAGSEQYRALVADEPEIGRISRALGGEAVIVWKGRAYRVKP